MFKKKEKPQPVENETITETPKPAKKGWDWLKFSILANIVLVVGIAAGLGGMAILHQSDTNPLFCRTCHNMERNVDSYLESDNLDNVHYQAGVQCKECHSEYGIPEEIKSGINFITGNYDKDMPRRKYGDDLCLQCHISMEHVAQSTDYLVRNPHLSHYPDLTCRTCHISHGEQIDYCGQCHDNGGQRLIGDAIVPRANNPFMEGGTSELNH